MAMTFVHLRVHSEYSIIQSIIKKKTLLSHLVEQPVASMALTDTMNLFGSVKFYTGLQAQGIKPILGTEIWVEDNESVTKAVFLCQNQQGYLNLCALLTAAYADQQVWEKAPLITFEQLSQYSEGIIVLSGARHSEIAYQLINQHEDLAYESAKRWMALFPDRFYIEIQRIRQDSEEHALNEKQVQLAKTLQLPLVATNAVCFLKSSDFQAHEARVCIQDGEQLFDDNREKKFTPHQYLKSDNEMANLFHDLPSALDNSIEIAKRCNFDWSLGNAIFPDFPTPGQTIDDYLKDKSHQGLKKRLIQLFPDETIRSQHRAEYEERLDLELNVIISMGFSGYFLIVADFIQWAMDNDIPVGPGRGSGAGSIVAYALNITNLDPIRYQLLFERFLNPERVSLPDFDVDFCMEQRDRVIDYVSRKYGRECVSQIATFGSMAAKAVVRDVGRVLGHPYGFVDKLAKLIPMDLGMTLSQAMVDEPILTDRYYAEDDVKVLMDLAKSLEGTVRNVGKHAGGVVIAPKPLQTYLALYQESGGGTPISQLDKDDVETVGLIKFDFLGLRTLTIIHWAIQMVNEKHEKTQQPLIDINHIPLDDKVVFDLLKRCETTAVFQLESRGMKDLIARLQPDCFEEIVALVALFRPGPLQSGMVDDFVDRKHGRAPVVYLHPMLETILEPTYGVILYQEQVMQIAQVLAGYTLGSADLLRRAMGKKKPEEMAKQRVIFTEGAIKGGIDKDIATEIFDLMEKFAGYGFNKSHSAAYALVSYQTAWLKTHYPASFMAAVLSSDMGNTEKVVIFLDECKAMGIKVRLPNIHESKYAFTVSEDQKEIIYGLGALKGLGEGAIEALIESRQSHGKPFTSLYELTSKVPSKKMNKKGWEALIFSGAMTDLCDCRATLLNNLDDAVKYSDQSTKNQEKGQIDLFSAMSAQSDRYPTLNPDKPWSLLKQLKNEKSILGFYFSGHPMSCYRDELKGKISNQLSPLRPTKKGQTITVAAIVDQIRVVVTKKGDRMAIVLLDDGQTKREIAVFPEAFDKYRDCLSKDELVIVKLNVTESEERGLRVNAEHIYDLSSFRFNQVRAVIINKPETMHADEFLKKIKPILTAYGNGQCVTYIDYGNQSAHARVKLGEKWHLELHQTCLEDFEKTLGENQVTLIY